VKYILEERHGYRIAVILNEYGSETGLESAFVQSSEVGGGTRTDRDCHDRCHEQLLCVGVV
jgi:hypothetical protein